MDLTPTLSSETKCENSNELSVVHNMHQDPTKQSKKLSTVGKGFTKAPPKRKRKAVKGIKQNKVIKSDKGLVKYRRQRKTKNGLIASAKSSNASIPEDYNRNYSVAHNKAFYLSLLLMNSIQQQRRANLVAACLPVSLQM